MTLLQSAKRIIAMPHAVAKCRHCEAAGRGNPWIHGLPRRFAPRSDGMSQGRRPWQMRIIARPQTVAKCRHCEAAGRGNPWIHGLPRRFAPRSDASNPSFTYAIGAGHFAGALRYA